MFQQTFVINRCDGKLDRHGVLHRRPNCTGSQGDLMKTLIAFGNCGKATKHSRVCDGCCELRGNVIEDFEGGPPAD